MSTELLLETAILKELAAGDFYREVARRINHRDGKAKFQELAREEDHHQEILKKWYLEKTGKEYDSTKTVYPPLFHFPVEDVFDSASALEALSVGITAEKEAIYFYTSFRDQEEEAEALHTLDQLIEFERGHLHRLQHEYDLVLNHFYWN